MEKDVRVGYAGNYQSDDGYIKIPEIKITGSRYFFSMRIRSHVNKYMQWWNAKSDMAWDRLLNAGRYNDHGVTMIGGAGDPAGIFDIAGQILSTWEPENKYLAMGVGLVAAVALKKPGLAKAEATGAYYSVAYEMKLAENLYPTGSYYAHFKAANTSLANAMASDAKFAAGISDLGIKIPTSATGSILGKSPTNWVWHHDVGTGIMQLAPKVQHSTGSIFWKTMHPDGLGGMKLWGLKSIK